MANEWITCPRCKGEGQVEMEWIRKRFVAGSGSTCPLCKGAEGFEDKHALKRAESEAPDA